MQQHSYDAFFDVDWSQIAKSIDMKVVKGDAEVTAFLKESCLDKPFVISECTAFNVITDKNSQISKTASVWEQAFPKEQDTILHDNTQAPLMQGHGSGDLRELWDLALNQQYLVQALKAFVINHMHACSQLFVARAKIS